MPLPFPASSSSDNRKVRSSISSESLAATADIKSIEEECLRLLFCGALLFLSTRKVFEVEMAHCGTPIALFNVDFAVNPGSCATCDEESVLLSIMLVMSYHEDSGTYTTVGLATLFN